MVALALLVSANMFSVDSIDTSSQAAFAGILIALIVFATAWSLYQGVLTLHQKSQTTVDTGTSAQLEIQVTKATSSTNPLPASTLTLQ
jgi:hypothetical protein